MDGLASSNEKFARWQLEKAAEAPPEEVAYHLNRAERFIGRQTAEALAEEMGLQIDWSSVPAISR